MPALKSGSMELSGGNFTAGPVAIWYTTNIGVLLLNKYLLSNYGLRYPIFLTVCHMIACSLYCYIAIFWIKIVPMRTIRSGVQFFKISALSLVFCASVVCGNISLRYLPVSFNQAIGATTPFITVLFPYLMTFKREAWLTYVTLIPVATGVIIASGVSYAMLLLLRREALPWILGSQTLFLLVTLFGWFIKDTLTVIGPVDNLLKKYKLKLYKIVD